MTELMTVVVMLLLALIGGVSTVALSYKKSPMKGMINKLILLCSSSIMQLLLLNLFRFMLLINNEIYSYSENVFLLLFDIILMILGVTAMSYYVKSGLKYRGLWSVQNIFLVGTMTYFMGEVILYYGRYHNIKSTIYEIFTVQNMVDAGVFALILCVITGVIYRLVKYQTSDILFRKSGIKNKIAITQPVVLLYVVTLWLYPVLETYLINSNEFDFTISKVWYCYLGVVLLVYVVCSAIFLVLKGKALEIVLIAVWSFSICAYIQSMFLNGKLFLMDGKEGEWTNSFQLVNVAVWFLMFSLLFGMRYTKNGGGIVLVNIHRSFYAQCS